MIRRKSQVSFNDASVDKCFINIIFSRIEKECYSIKVDIDGQLIPIKFRSTDETVLYLAILFCETQGFHLKRETFKYRSGKDSYEKSILRALFNRVKFSIEFEDWFAKVISDGAHRINDAKSKVNKQLKAALFDNHPELYSLLKIENENSRSADSCYSVEIDPSNIFFQTMK